jgi:hypothetical protein
VLPESAEKRSISPEIRRVVDFVDAIYRTGSEARVSLGDVLSLVADAEEFLRYFRDRTAIEAAVRHVPETIEAMAEKARSGNTEAARIILEVAGALGKAPRQQINIASQINLSMDDIEKLRRELLADGRSYEVVE